MAELKPCPFCGGEPRIVEHEFTGVNNTYGIKCECGTQGFQFWETIDEAIEAWNKWIKNRTERKENEES